MKYEFDRKPLENAYEGVPVKAPTLPPLGSFLPANQPSVTRL